VNRRQLPDHRKRELLEKIYGHYHGLHYLHPDPLEFVYRFRRNEDREIAGLLSAGLALGRVSSIRSTLEWIFARVPHPREMCLTMDRGDFYRLFDGFVYRFYTVEMLAELLRGIGTVLACYGSLEACFEAYRRGENGVNGALAGLYDEIYRDSSSGRRRILPDPRGPSACKRLHLFLRWMVREDEVDPGCWRSISPRHLIVPLDTHMLRFARLFGFTERVTGDARAAIEVTKGFQKFDFDDPVRYDFSVTRLGIHPEGSFAELERQIEQIEGRSE
jgi:uncharacterized protein (TIGR02757 family)